MSILWEKSETWRWMVRKTRDSKRFFFAFATVCGVVPAIIGYGVMQITNSRNEQLEAQLRRLLAPNHWPDYLNSYGWAISDCIGKTTGPSKSLNSIIQGLQGKTNAPLAEVENVVDQIAIKVYGIYVLKFRENQHRINSGMLSLNIHQQGALCEG